MGNTDAVTVSKEIQLLRLSIKLVNKYPEVQRKCNLKSSRLYENTTHFKELLKKNIY
ncbi:hypothetical protein ABID42_004307 [Arcicella rosea]|uniref:hypothetical protein n=1 Tax=Arcicella rosea TaxID=502909 RepID=UPI00345CD010